MADQAVPGRGNSGLKAVFGLVAPDVSDVSDVHEVGLKRTNEALEKGRSAGDNAVLPGGAMNLVIGGEKQNLKNAEKRAREDMLMQIIINEANNHLVLAEKYIEQAEQAMQAMEEIARDLQKTDEGDIDHDYYARELLSDSEYAATGGDPAKIQKAIADKYLDGQGSREIDHPYVRWIEKDNMRQEALVNARDHIEKAEDLNETLKSEDIVNKAAELNDSIEAQTKPTDNRIFDTPPKTQAESEADNVAEINDLSSLGFNS